MQTIRQFTRKWSSFSFYRSIHNKQQNDIWQMKFTRKTIIAFELRDENTKSCLETKKSLSQ